MWERVSGREGRKGEGTEIQIETDLAIEGGCNPDLVFAYRLANGREREACRWKEEAAAVSGAVRAYSQCLQWLARSLKHMCGYS